MKLFVLPLLGFGALACVAAPAKPVDELERPNPVPADQPIPVVDFFRAPVFTDPKLNDAGTHFAALVEIENDKTGLVVCDLATNKLETLRGRGDRDIYQLNWLNDDRLMFSLSQEKLWAQGVYVAQVGRLNRAYGIEQYSVVRPVGVPLDNRLRPIVWVYRNAYDNGKDAGVLQIDASRSLNEREYDLPGARGTRDESGLSSHGIAASVLQSFPPLPRGNAVAYLADPQGELAFGISSEEGRRTLFCLQGRNWIESPVDLDSYSVEAVGDQPGEILVLAPSDGTQPRALHRMDAPSGELGELVYQDKRYDAEVRGLYRHPQTRQVVGLRILRGAIHTVWLHPTYAAVQKRVEQQFPGEAVTLLGSDRAEGRFFVSAYSDRKPETYYLLDLEKRSLGLIKSTRPWIDPERMQRTHVVNFPTRDGRKLEGFLTLPSGASQERPAPLVVLAHGGPWSQDSWGWEGEVQFLASRGFAVFQPNYRGSLGSQWMFPFEELVDFWKMHEDVTDGVRTILKTGFIDEDRVAIMGGSFGGYLAVSGVAHDGDLYRCAITLAGVFDWEQLMREDRINDNAARRSGAWRRYLGEPREQQERFEAISPLRHVSQIRDPVFIWHGRSDRIADAAQSVALVKALEQHGVVHQALFHSGEAHGLSRLENRIELYSAIEGFLAKHLVPRSPAGAVGR